jgi:hypothetical protein
MALINTLLLAFIIGMVLGILYRVYELYIKKVPK